MRHTTILFALLAAALLFPAIVAAQGFEIFVKKKVAVADVIDHNDRELTEGVKTAIRQSMMDVCTNSEEYAVYEINMDDVRRQLKAKGLPVNFANICKIIQQKADYIIFPEVKVSTSALGARDVIINITATLHRLDTGTEHLSRTVEAKPDAQSIITSSSQMVARMLGIEQTKPSSSTQNASSWSQSASAQQPSQPLRTSSTKKTAVADDEPFLIAETMPSFQGGDLNKFRSWVQSNVRFPQIAIENGIQGRVVLSFVIERDGRLTNIHVLQSPDRSLSEETVRVLEKSPKWSPGKQRNQVVRVKYTLPIDFRQAEDSSDKTSTSQGAPAQQQTYQQPTYQPKPAGKKIGDLVYHNGIQGVVVALYDDAGEHGLLMSAEETDGNWNSAKSWCANLGSGWKLPSKSQLLLIHSNLKEIESSKMELKFHISGGPFWSSDVDARYNGNYAWFVNVVAGKSNFSGKYNNYHVRAVCAF